MAVWIRLPGLVQLGLGVGNAEGCPWQQQVQPDADQASAVALQLAVFQRDLLSKAQRHQKMKRDAAGVAQKRAQLLPWVSHLEESCAGWTAVPDWLECLAQGTHHWGLDASWTSTALVCKAQRQGVMQPACHLHADEVVQADNLSKTSPSHEHRCDSIVAAIIQVRQNQTLPSKTFRTQLYHFTAEGIKGAPKD